MLLEQITHLDKYSQKGINFKRTKNSLESDRELHKMSLQHFKDIVSPLIFHKSLSAEEVCSEIEKLFLKKFMPEVKNPAALKHTFPSKDCVICKHSYGKLYEFFKKEFSYETILLTRFTHKNQLQLTWEPEEHHLREFILEGYKCDLSPIILDQPSGHCLTCKREAKKFCEKCAQEGEKNFPHLMPDTLTVLAYIAVMKALAPTESHYSGLPLPEKAEAGMRAFNRWFDPPEEDSEMTIF